MFCKKCGKLLEEELDMCPECKENPDRIVQSDIDYSLYNNIEETKIESEIKKEQIHTKEGFERGSNEFSLSLLGFYICFIIGIIMKNGNSSNMIILEMILISIAKDRHPKNTLVNVTYKVFFIIIGIVLIIAFTVLSWPLLSCVSFLW